MTYADTMKELYANDSYVFQERGDPEITEKEWDALIRSLTSMLLYAPEDKLALIQATMNELDIRYSHWLAKQRGDGYVPERMQTLFE
jgi:hypothetical protein